MSARTRAAPPARPPRRPRAPGAVAGGGARERPRLKSEEAHARLHALLVGGEIRAGAFVSQQDLVAAIGLPMAPVREAVKRAAADGLVEVLPQRGVRVVDASARRILDAFGLRLLVDREGARKLARRGGNAATAAVREAHETLIARLRRGLTEAAIAKCHEVDWALHSALADAIDNALVAEIYAKNRDRLMILQRTRPMLPDRVLPSLTEHVAILAAIGARDPEAADAAVAAHARQTLRWWGFLNPPFD